MDVIKKIIPFVLQNKWNGVDGVRGNRTVNTPVLVFCTRQ